MDNKRNATYSTKNNLAINESQTPRATRMFVLFHMTLDKISRPFSFKNKQNYAVTVEHCFTL